MKAWLLLFAVVWVSSEASVRAQEIQSAKECAECHDRTFAEWRTSRHANSTQATNPFYAKMLGRARAEDEDLARNCQTCHEPVRFLNISNENKQAVANEGVTCDVCHATRLALGEEDWMTVVPGGIKFGPIKDALATTHGHQFSAAMKSAEVCLACHSNSQNPHGVTFCSTEDEWRGSSYAKNGIVCQDCHMPASEGKTAPLGKIRDRIHSHAFYGGYSKEILNNCAKLSIRAERNGEAVTVEIVVKNHAVGHALPTGSPMRMVLLTVEAKDAEQKPVWRNFYNNPLKEDPQAVFMKLLQDGDGRAPVPPWEAVSEKFDQRLKPDEERTLIYQFSDTLAVKITAALSYRLAPPPLLAKLQLTDEIYTVAKQIAKKTIAIP